MLRMQELKSCRVIQDYESEFLFDELTREWARHANLIGALAWFYGRIVCTGLLLAVCYAAAFPGDLRAQSATSTNWSPTELVELWRMGESEADDVLFSRIGTIRIDSQGKVYVHDWSHRGIYVISSEGSLSNVIGNEGAGPGEFEWLVGFYVGANDTVFALDTDHMRLSIFDPHSHDVVETLRIKMDESLAHPWRLIGVAPEGFVLSYHTPYIADETESMVDDPTIDIHLINRKGIKAKTAIAQVPDVKRIVFENGYNHMPFSPRPWVAMGSDGMVYAGSSSTSSIDVKSVNGESRSVIDWEQVPLPLTSEDLEIFLADRSETFRTRVANVELPVNKPLFSHMLVDDQHRVWLQLTAPMDAQTVDWWILNRSGEVVGSVILPVNVTLLAVRGQRAYGVKDTHILIAYALQ